MTDRYRQALEGLRERCAQEAERITGRRRVVASMVSSQAVKPCEVAAAIRKIDVQQHYECAVSQVKRLEEALREARDAIEDWAGYASDYFREKHDLAGDLAKIDALLRDQEGGLSNDRYQEIRAALAMGPTPGPWKAHDPSESGWVDITNAPYATPLCYAVPYSDYQYDAELDCERWVSRTHETPANAAYIAACDPDTIRELLAERDQLAAALEAAREDAERYRWLRKGANRGANDDVAVVRGLGSMDYGMSAVVYTYSEEIDGDDLDAAIDQARGKGGQEVGK